MSLKAAFARRLPELGSFAGLLTDLEADLELALARQEMARMMSAPRVLLAIQRAGYSQVYEVELAGVEWIERDAPGAGPPPAIRVWEEELPNTLVRPLGAAAGVGTMLHNAAPAPCPPRLIGDE